MFWDKYSELCKSIGKSPNRAAEEGKLFSTGMITKYKRGAIPNGDILQKVASYFNVTIDYLLGKDEQPEQSNVGAVFTDGIRMVPVFESVSAGFGAYADNHVVDTIPLLIRSSHEAEETICIRVTGDSMSPMIEDGDLIQVHKQDSVDSGDIAVVLLDGEEGLVKKVVYDTEFIDLISENPSYNTRHFEGEEVLRLRVVGKVKRVIRDL